MIESSGLIYAPHLQLPGKRNLIVLDDAWDPSQWYNNLYTATLRVKDNWAKRLTYGLPKGDGGSVIFTSRLKAVTNTVVGRGNVLRLQPLKDPWSCCGIFKDEVEKDGEKLNDDNIKKLKPEVTRRVPVWH